MWTSAYADWFSDQSPERQREAHEHLVRCARLRELGSADPMGEEAQRLRAECRAYYERWKE